MPSSRRRPPRNPASTAPAAIGPYSQITQAGRLLFVAGQIPINPATGELVAGGVEAQTDQVLKNVAAVLAAAGASLSHVVKTTVYLVEMADFAAMNDVYARHFQPPYPARSTVAVAGLPRQARVEIDVTAAL